MNGYANPTSLRAGMSGALSGMRFRVLGRVVMGMREAGETYYWQEFNVVDDSGRSATLVYEDGHWKLFLKFDPSNPMSAADAAGKHVGDVVNVDGRPEVITLVGQTRVFYIEGQPPPEVEIGDVANYFNAGEGMEMLVVSWTDDEVEFFRGMDLPPDEVARGFGLQPVLRPPVDEEPESSSMGMLMPVIVFVVVTVMAFGFLKWWFSRVPALPPKLPSRVASLSVGATGTLAGTVFAVTGRATMAIGRTGSRYDWHEYYLQDAAGDRALLVGGLDLGSNEWHLLRPVSITLLPRQAATLRYGDRVQLEGLDLQIVDLFKTSLQFGFLARSTNETAIVRWNEEMTEAFVGTRVPAGEVQAAFAAPKK